MFVFRVQGWFLQRWPVLEQYQVHDDGKNKSREEIDHSEGDQVRGTTVCTTSVCQSYDDSQFG